MARIVVVDDSGIVRRNMAIMLKIGGHEVVGEADNGISAYEEYKIKLPDLITMDLTMPDMDGIQAMRKIMTDFPDARIIVVSSSQQKEIIMRAIRSGASHFIIKPFSQEKLLSVVDSVLDKMMYQESPIEMAEKLKPAENQPYEIEDKDGQYVLITINDIITTSNVSELRQQIDNLLFRFHVRYIFDFKDGKMPLTVLPAINDVIQAIKKEEGMVRAVSSNAEFVSQIKNDKKSIISGLANSIRFISKQ